MSEADTEAVRLETSAFEVQWAEVAVGGSLTLSLRRGEPPAPPDACPMRTVKAKQARGIAALGRSGNKSPRPFAGGGLPRRALGRLGGVRWPATPGASSSSRPLRSGARVPR